MRNNIVLLLVLTIFKLRSFSTITNQSAQFCEVILSKGDFDEFRSKIVEFHKCLTTSKDFKLILKNYSLEAFPNDAFSHFGKVNRLKLEIEENSKLHLLLPGLPGDALFRNSRFDSVTLDVADLPSLMGWRWRDLADLEVSDEAGFEFNAVRSKLVYLDSDFNKVAKGRVTAVRILKCQLRWLGKNVFAPFSRLKTLELRGNLIENIERSHLPTDAPGLKILDLGNNKLKTLPANFVDGLNLQSIFLSENNLKITESQSQTILKSRNFPLLLAHVKRYRQISHSSGVLINALPALLPGAFRKKGVAWPCLCSKSSEISKTYGKHAKSVTCYKRDDDKLFNYLETCSQANIVDQSKYEH